MATKTKRKKDEDLIEVIKPRKCRYCGEKLVSGICCKKALAANERADKRDGIPSMKEYMDILEKRYGP